MDSGHSCVFTCQRWSQQISNTLAQQHQTVRCSEPVQRYEFHQNGGGKRKVGRKEQSKCRTDHGQRPEAVDEERHDGTTDATPHQANGVHLGDIHPRVISSPTEQYL